MYWFSVLSVLATASIGLANSIVPRWDDMKVKHTWDSIPDKWEHHSHPPDHATIDLRIALKPHRENALIGALYEVSDPDHPKCVFVPLCPQYAFMLTHRWIGCQYRYRYGAHLSKERVAELVAPHPDTIEHIGSWLEHHDVPASLVSFTHGGCWLTLSGLRVAQADVLLGASYRLHPHTSDRRHSPLLSGKQADRAPTPLLETRCLPHSCQSTSTPHCTPRCARVCGVVDHISILDGLDTCV